MNFFEAQEQAKRHTTRLVVLFALAILGVITAVYLVISFLLAAKLGYDLWDPKRFAEVALVTGAIMWCGSLYKMGQLRGGGAAVAEALGGTPIYGPNATLAEKRLLNVVEEMSIASGSPMPAVYVLRQEKGLNAFAAGTSIDNAVVAVTQGTLDNLTRDELQGVIAHEFSHIFHGDMRLNMKLMGWIHGILLLALIGQQFLRAMSYSPSRRSKNDKGSGGIMLALMVLAVSLIVVGFIGVFFGKLIKATVSRQREYLADASSVQYTRYPQGLAMALKKIGGLSWGSDIAAPKAEQASHMYFAAGITGIWSGFFTTHPPLADRIKRVEPGWDGAFPTTWPDPNTVPEVEHASERDTNDLRDLGMAAHGVAAFSGVASHAVTATAMDGVGTISEAHLAYAHDLVGRLPREVVDAAREPYGARALIFALLLADDEATRTVQLQALQTVEPPAVIEWVTRFGGPTLPVESRVPLLDIAIPSLRRMSKPQKETFRHITERLIEADGAVSLFEWMLQNMLERHVNAPNTRKRHRTVPSLAALEPQLGVLLSALAWGGHADEASARLAFDAGAAALALPRVSFQADRSVASLGPLTEALSALEHLTPRLKQHVLRAAAACIGFDKQVTIIEAELFRGIGDRLGCPVPPLLPGQPLA